MRNKRELPLEARARLWLMRKKKAYRKPKRRAHPKRIREPRAYLDLGHDKTTRFGRIWARLAIESVTAEMLGELLGKEGISLDEGFATLHPALENKTITDIPLAEPTSLIVRGTHFEDQTVPVPLDWETDALGLYDWRLWFQSLRWLDRLYTPAGEDLDLAAFLVVAWHDTALSREPAFECTWSDHGMTSRLDAVDRFLHAYVQHNDTVDRRVLSAAFTIILSHLFGLTVADLYAKRHNHGFMQDRSLLIRASKLPALVDAEELAALAERRIFDEQIALSITPDFVHVENSPTYHLLYIQLITTVLNEAYAAHDRTPPPQLVEARDRMLDSLVHLIRPNLTLVQFGDTLRDEVTYTVRRTIRAARRTIPFDPDVVKRLEHVFEGGERDEGDHVFRLGGYASFRANDDDDPGMSVHAHFKGTRGSTIHWHQDDTSFQIYGFGDELVVDPGRYANDRKHPMSRFAVVSKAHNLLIVNKQNFHRPTRPSGILGSGIDDGVSWVQAAHTYYASLGVTHYVRSFVFFKPRVFVIVDSVRATSRNLYEQHFHLHPRLAAQPSGLARREDGAGVLVSPLCGDSRIKLNKSWFFPKAAEAVPTSDLTVQRKRSSGLHHMPVVMTVFGPDEAPIPPQVTLAHERGALRVRLGGPDPKLATLPLPPDLSRF